jgi:hypothetical protein
MHLMLADDGSSGADGKPDLSPHDHLPKAAMITAVGILRPPSTR